MEGQKNRRIEVSYHMRLFYTYINVDYVSHRVEPVAPAHDRPSCALRYIKYSVYYSHANDFIEVTYPKGLNELRVTRYSDSCICREKKAVILNTNSGNLCKVPNWSLKRVLDLVLMYNQMHTNNKVDRHDVIIRSNKAYKQRRRDFKKLSEPYSKFVSILYNILAFDVW